MPLPTAHKIVPQSERCAELVKLFIHHKDVIKLEPGGWVLPSSYEKYADDLFNFMFQKDDVLIMSVPKSGSTWMKEILWTMRNNPKFDNPTEANKTLNTRVPLLEADMVAEHGGDLMAFVSSLSEESGHSSHIQGIVKDCQSPRTMKTHLSLPHLSPTLLDVAKVVFIIRDPRDVCISFYKYSKIINGCKFVGTFDEYVDGIIKGAFVRDPYWSHVKEAWPLREHPNLHIVFYEQLKKNTKEELAKLDKFIGSNLTGEQLDKIVHYTSFTEMKSRNVHIIRGADPNVVMNMDVVMKEGGFFRQGTAGGWKNVLTQQQKDKFQAWIEANCPDADIMKIIDESL